MINLIQIAWRFLIGRHSSGLISFSFFLSVIGLAIGTASLLLISGFSNGFSKEVQTKLASIDGEIRIEKYGDFPNSMLSENEFIKIKKSLNEIKEIDRYYLYSQTQAMLQSGQQTDGTLLFGMENHLLNSLTSHSKLNPKEIEFRDNGIILGSQLANNLGLHIGDYVNLFDLNLLMKNQQIKGLKLLLIGTIKTGFSEYDKLISFIPKNTYQKFYLTDGNSTGIILDINSINISKVAEEIREMLDFPIIINTWEERHSILLNWMQIYNIPIQLVMGFITLLAIFNISSTLWMISIDKTGNVGILKAMGYSSKQVQQIFVLKGAIIGIIGIISGLTLSVIVYFLQNNYQIISLSSEVYFLDYLPIYPNLIEIMTILIGIFFVTLLLALIPANNVKNIIPSLALKED